MIIIIKAPRYEVFSVMLLLHFLYVQVLHCSQIASVCFLHLGRGIKFYTKQEVKLYISNILALNQLEHLQRMPSERALKQLSY
jgi:hypothetical protein